jgi:hypothetical protein
MINENLAKTKIQYLDESIGKYNDSPCGEEELELQSVLFDMHDCIINQDMRIKDQDEEISKMKEMIFGLYEKIETLSK